jgi:hypothetical protein
MARGVQYSVGTVNEAIALYESGEPVTEINRALGLQKTTIYHFLKERGITPRTRVKDLMEPPSNGKQNTLEMLVTTDKEGFVQSVQRKTALVFEVAFTGLLEIQADTLEEAISNARKRAFVGRIHSVREK